MEICKYCGKECKNILSKVSHENTCKNNPNRRDLSGKNNPRYGKEQYNKRPKTAPYKIQLRDYSKDKHDPEFYKTVELDKTIQEVEDYKKSHLCCEICGRSDGVLCIDHDHKTNKFRGILCQPCNRSLGWFDNNEEKIKKYLARGNA